MPNRIIRDSARSSPTLEMLTDGAERTFWRLTTAADDYGRFDADPRAVLAACHPLSVNRVTVRTIEKRLDEMARAGLVLFYRSGDRLCGVFVQAIKYFDRRARTSRFPDPPDVRGMCAHMPACASTCSQMPRSTEERGTEVPRNEERGAEGSVLAEHAAAAWPSPEALQDLYNQESPDECPAVQVLSPKRREKARAFLAKFPDEAFWREAMAQCRASPFLRGLRKRDGHNGFVADLDWLLTVGKDGTENVVKVHDGRYRDG